MGERKISLITSVWYFLLAITVCVDGLIYCTSDHCITGIFVIEFRDYETIFGNYYEKII